MTRSLWALALLSLWACDDGGEAPFEPPPDAHISGRDASILCGDGLRQSPEQCDDGNNEAGDGCDPLCVYEDPPTATARINEIVAKAADGGADWIEIYNPTSAPLDISGWALTDEADEAPWALPAGTILPPMGFLVFEKDVHFTFGLGAIDAARLLDAHGAQMDATSWGETHAPEGMSWGRLPDGVGAFQTLNQPTPGASNRMGEGGEGACGDGRLDAGEACDDGNTTPGDGCDALCQPERPEGVCGDGALNAGEACDDGNTTPGDGCDAACQLEAIPEGLIINEVMPLDAEEGADWIELRNLGAAAISLTGWRITDSDLSHEQALPEGLSVPPGGYLVLTRGVAFDFGLGQDDRLSLSPPFGAPVDEVAWAGAVMGQSWGRIPDGEGAFKWLHQPTPGAANVENEGPDLCGDGVLDAGEGCDDGNTTPGDGCGPDCHLEAAPALVINEVMVADAAGGPDWIELYSLDAAPVALDGWQIGDDDPTHLTPLSGLEIPAGGFLVLTRDVHFDFGFGGADTARLLAPGALLVDEVAWIDGAAPAGVTWGRLPDGVGAFEAVEPTPNVPNRALVAAPTCGDGALDAGEACDDGNTTPGDGCDAACQIEPAAPSCGDGALDAGEACDDGNTTPGDGCDAACQIEPVARALVINEVMVADAAGGPDWIELYNADVVAANLNGWTICDADPNHATPLDGLHVEPGGYLVLLKDVAFTFGLGAADEARLSAPDGALVDQAIWLDGEAPEGATWGRLPNGAGPFQALYAPTPGAANEAGVAPSICGDGVVDDGEACDDGDVEPGDGCDALCAFEPSRLWINEVVAAGADGGPDWIELYHHGLQPLDVSGWSVTDDSPESPDHRWTFADGIALAPMSHLVLTRDVEFLFGLGAADSVILYDASGLVVDQTSWLDGEAPIGQSWGRLPDGGDFQTLSAPTPGAPNLN